MSRFDQSTNAAATATVEPPCSHTREQAGGMIAANNAQGFNRDVSSHLCSCQVVEFDKVGAKAWDEYVRSHRDGTFFHLCAWREAVHYAFGHAAHYLAAKRGNRVVGVAPMFLVKSMLAGRMLVSVPCGVGGGIIADDMQASEALLSSVKELAVETRVKVVDLRSERALFEDLPTVDRYVGFRRALPARRDEVLGWLPRKARAAARNGRKKYDLHMEFGDRYLPEVWRMYSASMRRLASPNYPFSFLKALAERSGEDHWTSIVYWKGEPVACLLTFLFGDVVMPYFIGTTDKARQCSAANFAYLSLMERGVDEGYRVFDFGRSRLDNTGSYDFKRFHGFEPRPMGYQYFVPPGGRVPDLVPSSPSYRLARAAWSKMPLCVTRPLGAYLTRHIPG